MKKKYLVPELNPLRLNTRSMLCLSKGADESDGVAEAKKFWGNSFWGEDESDEEENSPVL